MHKNKIFVSKRRATTLIYSNEPRIEDIAQATMTDMETLTIGVISVLLNFMTLTGHKTIEFAVIPPSTFIIFIY